MILSWANTPSRLVLEKDRRRFAGLDLEAAHDSLTVIDSATRIDEIAALRWTRLCRLGQGPGARWAIQAGDDAWICFRFEQGNAYDLDVVEALPGWLR